MSEKLLAICLRSLLTALILLTAVPAGAQTYTLRTFAGGALPENIPAASASLGAVYGVALDKSGNLFLSLGEYHAVLRLDAATGMLTRVAGSGTAGCTGDDGPATGAQLSAPAGLAVDASGKLYIADSGNFRVRRISNGTIAAMAGNGTQGYGGDRDSALNARFDGVAGIAVDAAGNLYIADFYNNAIRKVTAGTITTVAGNGTYGSGGDNGPATRAQLAGPSGIAVDVAGNLYIAEAYGNRIRKVSNGIITTVAGNGTAGFSGDKAAATSATLRQPSDVAVDSSGNLYIADYGNNRIRMVAAGVITTLAGNGGVTSTGDLGAATSAGMVAPRRIALDPAGNLYIADGVRLRRVSKGVISTVAGGGLPLGENGPAAGAQLLSPQGLALDGAGNLYLSDAGTGRVLKVTNGVLTRVAGTGIPGFNGDGPAATTQLLSPSGVAVDSSGSLYVADTQNARVRKIAGGAVTTVAGGGTVFGDDGPATKAQLTAPEGLAVDAGGKLFIADVNRVRAVSNGTITTAAGNGSVGYQGDSGLATAARLSSPAGLAVGSSGQLWIADSGNDRVRLVSAGTITTVAGTGTYGFSGGNGAPTSATLGNPVAVAADTAGDLYITDAYRVLRVSKGKIASIAGLDAPQGVVVDAAGTVYVADPAGHRVAVLTPAATACAVSATPAAPQYPATGGAYPLAIQTGASCSWTVESMPAWIGAASTYGAGPGALLLGIAANPDVPRTATILVGGQNVTVSQAGIATFAGQVTLPTGGPLPGVSIALSGSAAGTAITDSGGNYAVSNLSSAGAYTLTPSLAGYSFVPASQTFSNVFANPAVSFVAWRQPRIAGFAPAFASSLVTLPGSFAAGEVVTLYGADFCAAAAAAAPTLPDRLAACIVKVDGATIRLYYGSAGQINAVLPQTLALGPHLAVVERYTDTGYKQLAAQSAPFTFTVDRIGMAFLERAEGGANILLAQYLDGGFAGPARPLHAGDSVVLYLTGLGKKAQTFAEGTAPQKASAAVEPVQIQVQGLAAQVLYAGVQPQYPGLDQITLQLPKYTLAPGEHTATIQVTAPSTGQVVRYVVESK
jgi:uncharacterized protein (TIGR03437 family)